MAEKGGKQQHAQDILRAAVDAVHPSKIIPHVLSLNGDRLHVGEDNFSVNQFASIYIAGAGKASAAMAYEVEKILTHHISEGVIAVRDDFEFPLRYTRAISGGHPLPDANSIVSAQEITKLLDKLTSKDLLIFLLSGGASSLMFDMPEQCTLEEVNGVLNGLMRGGATIRELNTVRKHLSELKGGQLVKKCSGATVICFIISDVIGNDLQVIGSGPTVGDDSTSADALAVLEKYKLKDKAPYTVTSFLMHGVEGNIDEHPKPGDKIFNRTRNNIIADNDRAIAAAKARAIELGYTVVALPDMIQGFAEKAAQQWVEQAKGIAGSKTCLLGGGETTVQVRGRGKGGRCQQFALAAAIALRNFDDITLLAAGTDGSDGPTDAAGAVVDEHTYDDAKRNGLIAEDYLHDNDAYRFFEQTGNLIKTGPTNTNVMDIVVGLIN